MSEKRAKQSPPATTLCDADTEPPALSRAVEAPRHPRRRELLAFFSGVAAAVPAALTWRSNQTNERFADREPTPMRRPIRALSRPRATIVIPEHHLSHLLGRALGELLEHGSSEYLAALSVFELECVSAKELAIAMPQDFAIITGSSRIAFSLAEPLTDAAVDNRIISIGSAFRTAATIATSEAPELPATLKEVVRRCRARKKIPTYVNNVRDDYPDYEDEAARNRYLAPLSPSATDRYAPSLYALAQACTGEGRECIEALLAARVKARHAQVGIKGSEWASSGGCGASFDEWTTNRRGAVGCGMGQIPERSRRFLSFYTTSF